MIQHIAMNQEFLRQLSTEGLDSYLSEILGGIGNSRRQRWCKTYVRGLLLPDCERKSIQPMAKRLQEIDKSPEDYEQALQHCVSQSRWDHYEVLERLQSWITRHIGSNGYLIIEDVHCAKQGSNSIGVAKQFRPQLDREVNCQVSVMLRFVKNNQAVCLDSRLYLPENWVDAHREATGGNPGKVEGNYPHWVLAQDMLKNASMVGYSGVVIANATYGAISEFRQGLRFARNKYIVQMNDDAEIDVFETVEQGMGSKVITTNLRNLPRTHLFASGTIDPVGVQLISRSESTQGTLENLRRQGIFVASSRLRTSSQISNGPPETGLVLIHWPDERRLPTGFFASNLSLSEIERNVLAIKSYNDWSRQNQLTMEEDLGWSDFEGRSWNGWCHHTALVLVANAYLQFHSGRQLL